jgi:hypothetical protein
MPSLRSLPQGLTSREAVVADVAHNVFAPATEGVLAGVARLISSYPFPHSIFGGSGAEAYVRGLATRACQSGEGWYGLGRRPEWLTAAAYLGIYGMGRGDGHTLWKIRHPLSDSSSDDRPLAELFEELVTNAMRARPGTAKFVVFFGEHEDRAMRCAVRSGFRREACFPDYYRLGEKCLVYGRTVR